MHGLKEIHISQLKQARLSITSCIATKKPVFSESKRQMPDDSYRWGRHTFTPIFDIDEQVQQIMVTSVDITELVNTQKLFDDSQKQLEEVLTKTLSGFVKICSNCKKIRHEDEWQPIEQYASEQMDYHEFSHGMCDECAKELYGYDILAP